MSKRKKQPAVVELTQQQCLDMISFGVNLVSQVRSLNPQISVAVLSVNNSAVKYQASLPGEVSYQLIITWEEITAGSVAFFAKSIVDYFGDVL